MFTRKNVCVLDVEGMSGKRPYNIGYIIGDLHGNIKIRRSFALMPFIMENLSTAMKSAQETAREMTHKNIKEILENPSKYHWDMPQTFFDRFIQDLVENDVKEIWAYNCAFDKSAISRVMEYLDKDNIISQMGISWLDIWSAIVMTKCCCKKYVKFCKKNGFMTEKGNCKTSAEVVWGYLTNNSNFEEEHTGLADCEIEYKILLTAKSTKKKVDGTIRNPWKLVQQFCEQNEI